MRKGKKTHIADNKDKETLTETKLILRLIIDLMLIPFRLISVLFGKDEFRKVFTPFHTIFTELKKTPVSMYLILANTNAFLLSMFFPSNFLENLAVSANSFTNPISFISAGFLHASFAHFLGNMFFLFIFARIVEKELGVKKTLFTYFSAMIISHILFSIVYYLLKSPSFGIGASGAISGMIATAMLLKPFKLTYAMIVPLPVMVVGWIAISTDVAGLLDDSASGVSHIAHIGGFLSITLIMYLLGGDDKTILKKGLLINGFSLLLYTIVAGLLTL